MSSRIPIDISRRSYLSTPTVKTNNYCYRSTIGRQPCLVLLQQSPKSTRYTVIIMAHLCLIPAADGPTPLGMNYRCARPFRCLSQQKKLGRCCPCNVCTIQAMRSTFFVPPSSLSLPCPVPSSHDNPPLYWYPWSVRNTATTKLMRLSLPQSVSLVNSLLIRPTSPAPSRRFPFLFH